LDLQNDDTILQKFSSDRSIDLIATPFDLSEVARVLNIEFEDCLRAAADGRLSRNCLAIERLVESWTFPNSIDVVRFKAIFTFQDWESLIETIDYVIDRHLEALDAEWLFPDNPTNAIDRICENLSDIDRWRDEFEDEYLLYKDLQLAVKAVCSSWAYCLPRLSLIVSRNRKVADGIRSPDTRIRSGSPQATSMSKVNTAQKRREPLIFCKPVNTSMRPVAKQFYSA